VAERTLRLFYLNLMAENYLILGDDKLVSDKEIAKIRDKALSQEAVSFNYSVHMPSDMAGLMDSLGTLPILSEKRVVLLKEAGSLNDENVEDLVRYLEKPCESSVFIISADASFKKSGRYRKISRLMKTVSADSPPPATIKSWIRAFFEKEGLTISTRAVDLVVELKGADTAGIKTEIEKLAGYCEEGKIDTEDVEKLVGRSVTEVVFKLVDAINARDAKWAFRILEDLYDQKKHPVEIIGYLSWYMRMMQNVKLLSGKGFGPEEIAEELGYSSGYVKRLLGQSRKHSAAKIGRWVTLLFDTDRAIKTGSKAAPVAMDMLIAEFVG